MTTTTFFGDTSDGRVKSNDAAWANVLNGTGTKTASSTGGGGGGIVGPMLGSPNYENYDLFVGFDTSSLDDASTVTSAVLSMFVAAHGSLSGSVVLSAYDYDWGTTVTTADYRTQSQLAALTNRGSVTYAVADSTGTEHQYTLSSPAAIVNLTGSTRFVLAADSFVAGTTPTDNRECIYDMADTTGTTTDPKLVVISTVSTNYTLTATAVSGTSTVSPTMRFGAKATATVAGTSTVSPTPHMQGLAAGAAVGHATITATEWMAAKTASAVLGTSTVSPTPHMQAHPTAAIVGAGTVIPTPHMQGFAASAVLGHGTLIAPAWMAAFTAAALHGLPSLVSTARLDSKIVVSVNGSAAVGTPTPLSRGQSVVASPTGTSTIGAAAWMHALVQAAAIGQSTIFGSQHMKALMRAAVAGASTVSPTIHMGSFVAAAVHGVPTISGRALLYGTVTVYATSDYIFLNSTSQANLEAGSGSQSSGGNTILDVGAGGQLSSWSAYESLLSFDTSGLPLHSVLQSAVVHLYGTTLPTTDFFLKSYWVTSSGWKTKAQLAALTAASSTYTAGVGTGYNAITLDVSHSGITQGSTAKIVLASGDYVAGSGYPTSAKILSFSSERQSGASQDPYMVFTWVIGDDLTLDATTLHGTPSVTPTIHMAGRAASAVTGAGVVAGSPHMQANLATLTVTGAAVLDAAGRRGQESSASIAAAGVVGATGRRGQNVVASPVGTSSLSAGIHMAALVHAALLQQGQVGTAAFIATLLMSATNVRGASVVVGNEHWQGHASAPVVGHGQVVGLPHSQTRLAATAITAHATITAHLLAIAIAAHVAAHGSISANAIRKLYIQAVIDGASIIQTGGVFDDEGQHAAMRGHGWTVADGTPWYERLVRQGGV